MRPARPFPGGRPLSSSLRLVGGPEVPANELLEQAESAEQRGRPDLARDLYERALLRAGLTGNADIAASAMLATARIANAAGETGVALDILEAAVASATARGSDVASSRATALRARVSWESGDLIGAESDAWRAREWATRASEPRDAAQALGTLAALAVARGNVDDGITRYEQCIGELRALGHVADLSATLASLAELYDDVRRWDASGPRPAFESTDSLHTHGDGNRVRDHQSG